jgi:hypothetical protein
VPSQPPLLHLPPPLPTRFASQPPPDRAIRPLVNVPVVIAASAVGFALIVSVLAWIVTHPVKASQPPEPATTPIVLAAAPEEKTETPAPVPVAPPAFASAAITPVSHVNRQDVVLNRIPLIEEAPPPLPPPPRRETEPEAEAAAPANGETYGTNVLFMNNPAAAAESARRDDKLLFVMHISGNFEDSCFT